MRQVYRDLEAFAAPDVPVLIEGETGTGKTLCARALRDRSDPDQPWVPVNCAALSESLIDSELFGHRKGAFTGAVCGREGLLARADGGVLFLDEVAELPPHSQAKLLGALETGHYRPLGGERRERSDFRLLAATHRDLDALVEEGAFRADLRYRLGAATLRLPPLRERKDDLPRLAAASLHETGDGGGPPARGVTADAMELIRSHPWPGNVRQLDYVVRTAAALTGPRPVIRTEELRRPLGEPAPDRAHSGDGLATLEEARERVTRRQVERALRRTGGHRGRAAELLDVSESTLYRTMDKLGIGP